MLDFVAVTPVMAILAVVLGYLAGSIPFGLLFTRWAGLGDVRSIGSGNIGATNVLRTGNKTLAALTLIADAAKGTIPILIMKELGGETADPFIRFTELFFRGERVVDAVYQLLLQLRIIERRVALIMMPAERLVQIMKEIRAI